MKRIILILIYFVFLFNLYGQGFIKEIGILENVFSNNLDINEAANGDLFFSNGDTETLNSELNQLSSAGTCISKHNPNILLGSGIHVLEDNSYISISAYESPFDSTAQIYGSRIDQSGNVIWQRRFTDEVSIANSWLSLFGNRVNGKIPLSDGILIYGSKLNVDSTNTVDDFPYMFKINWDGEVNWEIELSKSGTFELATDYGLKSFSNRFHRRGLGEALVESDIEGIRFIAKGREYEITTSGIILSDEDFVSYEPITLSDLPIYANYVSEDKVSRLYVDDGEIILSFMSAIVESVDPDYPYYEYIDIVYLTKYDKNHERVWIKTVQWDDVFKPSAPGFIRLLPNGNVIYIPSHIFNNILEFNTSNGEIEREKKIESAGTYYYMQVFERDGYFMCLGQPTSSTGNYLEFFKIDYDLNSYDFNRTTIPPNRSMVLSKVETLTNGDFVGLGREYNSAIPFSGSLIAFRADKDGLIFTNEIKGSVLGLLNNECVSDSNDLNLASWEVKAEGNQLFNARSDSNGDFRFQIDTGSYKLSIIPKNDYWLNCDTTEVEFTNFFDTLSNVDLITSAISPCSFIEVDVGFGVLRRCFSNRVVVQYCNQGTFAEDSTMVELHIDSYLDVDMTSIPIASQQDTTLFFDIGEVGIGECGKFNIWVTPNCDNAVLGQEHCIDARVFPDTLCVPQDSLWSGANVVVEAICEGDSTLFNLVNIGNAPTKDDLAYIVIVDDIIVSRGDTYSLAAGESIQFVEYEPGSSIKVIAEQEPFHPLGNQVGVEAFCAGTDFDFISSFNQFDNDPFTDMVCVENRGSFDPNDKSAIPLGSGAEHYISSAQDLEYKIRFQNTGTDTAFTVVIRDTIASELDMSSFAAGISSHDYTVAIEQGNILIFTFDNILLPDSTTNLVESNGFVEFKIDQVDGNLPETVIENTAAIFFDFNDPIITNTVFHTIETPVTFSVMHVDVCANEMYDQVLYSNDTMISVLHASPFLDSFAIVDIHLLPVDSIDQYLNVEYGTTINEDLITMDTIIYEDYINSFGCDSIVVKNIVIENATSISLVDKENWEVFPNPTKGSISIATNQSFTDDVYTVSVMSIVGIPAYEQDHRIAPNESLNLDLRNLSAGTYLLHIASKHGMITEKIVINP